MWQGSNNSVYDVKSTDVHGIRSYPLHRFPPPLQLSQRHPHFGEAGMLLL